MARQNTKPKATHRTHEGAPAFQGKPEQVLRRSLLACMLWEDSFYEDGEDIAARIRKLAHMVKLEDLSDLAIEARTRHNLRHAPLLLVHAMTDHPDLHQRPHLVGETIAQVIQRPDELAEFLALHWKGKKRPLSKQMKRGLAKAFCKFDAYALAKYNRDNAIKLRDVLFMVHAKPKDESQAALWERLVNGTLLAPDTWEVALSGGADKKETFERLIRERKLGYLALLRNLRNMEHAGVDRQLVLDALAWSGNGRERVLPFRFIAALRAAPGFASGLDNAMQAQLHEMPRLPGRTVVLVDVSKSMEDALSSKSDLTRMDAGAALSVLVRGIADDCRVFTFSDRIAEVPAYQGIALCDAIPSSQPHMNTYLGRAIRELDRLEYDRLIVVTDEESHDVVGGPKEGAIGYMINVSTTENTVGYGTWTRITGFSESVVEYIRAAEQALR